MNYPVIPTIKTMQDVKTAFDNIRTWFSAQAKTTTTIKSQSTIRQSRTALTPSVTVIVNWTGVKIFTLAPGEDETLTASGTGDMGTIIITASGSVSRTLTFGTGFRSSGTISTGTTAGRIFTITFAFDGTNWNEVSRVANL